MADTTLTWTDTAAPKSIGATLSHHLRVLVRAYRMGRGRRARMRVIQFEMRDDPRWYADVGVDIERDGPRDWIGAMARAMGMPTNRC